MEPEAPPSHDGHTMHHHKPIADPYQYIAELEQANAALQARIAAAEAIAEQQPGQQELRTFQALVEQALDGVVTLALDGMVVYANTACKALFGYGEELIGKHALDVVVPHDRERMAGVLQGLGEAGRWQGMVIYQRADGQIFLGQVAVAAIRNTANEIVAFGAIIRDMTEQVQREEELRLAQFALDHSASDIHFVDTDGLHIYVNVSACRSLGYTRDELLAMKVSDINPDMSHEIWIQIWEQLKQTGAATFEARHRRKDGSIFPVEVAANYLQFDDKEYVCALSHDITERRQIEQQQQRMVAVLENNPDFVGMVDLDGHPIYINPAGRQMVGITSSEQFFQTQMLEYVFVEDREHFLQNILPELMEQGIWQGELRFQHFQTGAPIPVYYNVFTVKDMRTGEPVAMATVTRDLTDWKRAEAERLDLQNQIIEVQQATLRELSTPLLPIADDVLVMPIIGTIDSMRAQQIMETLLEGVSSHRARIVILDITGVQVIDTQVANALIHTAQATRLLGAQVVLTGIQPNIAQTLVHLGVNLGNIVTHSSLQSGIAYALRSR